MFVVQPLGCIRRASPAKIQPEGWTSNGHSAFRLDSERSKNMFLFWLLWLTIVIGGFYLGIGYALEAFHIGGIGNALNALVYCGCAIFGLPKLFKLVFKK